MLRPSDVREIRERIYHSQPEFAELLGRLRGVPISERTVESWEQGLIKKPIALYLTDLAAIETATKPRHDDCEMCRAHKAIVRKRNADMCQDCAIPHAKRDHYLAKKQTIGA